MLEYIAVAEIRLIEMPVNLQLIRIEFQKVVLKTECVSLKFTEGKI